MKSIDRVHSKLEPLIQGIKHHPLYAEIKSIADLRIFMEHHVFCVWDFMCLLKELHSRLVTTRAPWFPPKDPDSAHLINKILSEEESDFKADGTGYCSHFELYLTAMKSVGANTNQVQAFLAYLIQNRPVEAAAESAGLPEHVKEFIVATFSFFSKDTHILAAAFVYGREAITTSLFIPLVEQLKKTIPTDPQFSVDPLLYYLNRHIQLDGESHFPKAVQILKNLANDDQKKWNEIFFGAEFALQARLKFLTALSMNPLFTV